MPAKTEIMPEVMPSKVHIHIAVPPELVPRLHPDVPVHFHWPSNHMAIEVPNTPVTRPVHIPATPAVARAAALSTSTRMAYRPARMTSIPMVFRRHGPYAAPNQNSEHEASRLIQLFHVKCACHNLLLSRLHLRAH